MIQFACPECGRQFELPVEQAGRRAKCSCGTAFQVPTTEAPPAPGKVGTLLRQISREIRNDFTEAPDPTDEPPKLIACIDCAGQLSRRAAVCPHCGAPGPTFNAGTWKIETAWVNGFATVLSVFGMLLTLVLGLGNPYGVSVPAMIFFWGLFFFSIWPTTLRRK